MNKYSIRNSFLLFTIFLIFYSIFYLYFKHDVGNDWSISEWLINYKGGFTRRGLGGEINIFLSNFFSISLRDRLKVSKMKSVAINKNTITKSLSKDIKLKLGQKL